MGRQRTGCAQWDPARKVWVAILTVGEPGHTTRQPVDMPAIKEGDEAGAKEFAKVLARRAATAGAVPEASGETVSEWWKRYHEAAERGEVGRRNKGRPQVSIGARRQRFRDFIEPHLGTIPMAAVRPEDVHRVVVALNAAMRERVAYYARPARTGPKPGMSPKQAAHVWSEMRSGFGEACTLGNVASLKVRGDDPTEHVTPPTGGGVREMAALYPSELLALLSCSDVPLFRRAVYAVGCYTGVRQSELRALRKRDVDLEHRLLRVVGTKTEAADRDVPIHANLVPLLERILAETKGDDDPILRVPPPEDCAAKLRTDLERAGVTRAALTEDTETKQPFCFHGLRHTCLTWWAVAHGSAWTLAASGHTDHKTAERYVNKANLLKQGRFGEPHPPLPTSLIESSGYRSFVNAGGANYVWRKRKLATPMGIERTAPVRLKTRKNKPPRSVTRPAEPARNVPGRDVETLSDDELLAELARRSGGRVA